MTVVDSLMRISKWMDEHVCKDLKFKAPPMDMQKPINGKYEYQEVTPKAFPMFLPTSDRLPPGINSNMPSICVQLVTGKDNNIDTSRELNINLGFSCWNPGLHSKDIYYPEGTRPEEAEAYRSTADGWMDVWNFVDYALRQIEMVTDMNGLEVVQSEPITFGPYKEQDAVPDFYPHWFAWINFTVRTKYLRNNVEDKLYEEFL